MAPALEPPLIVRLSANLSPETVAAYSELVADPFPAGAGAGPARPWRVFIGDPLTAVDAPLTFVGSYSRPRSALTVAETIAAYGELGGWRTVVRFHSIASPSFDAGLVVEPASVEPELGVPRGIVYRPYGPDALTLIAVLAPLFPRPEVAA